MVGDTTALRCRLPVNSNSENPRKLRILIIEDGKMLGRLLGQLLEHFGYQVEVTESGQEGIELYRQEPADLVITDIWLPDMDGRDIIRQLRMEFPEIRVIAMSGAESVEEPLSEARRLGARRTFRKPFDTQELLLGIEEELAGVE